MDRSFSNLSFFLLLGLSVVFFAASSAAKPIEVEDIQDPVLKEQIVRQVGIAAFSPDGEEDVGDEEPTPQRLSAESILPYPLCGTFILCERKGSSPDAQLFTSSRGRVFPKTEGRCRSKDVAGTGGHPSTTQNNHARLWPIFGEEFYELCEYTERQHACRTGTVTVQNSHGHVLYECNQAYDAHTVEFCMSKYPYYCRYRNPAEITFATTTPARRS